MTLVVDGQCMGDALPHGSEARIEPRRFYRPGDIVVFGRGNGMLVSHRFLGYIPGRSGWLALTRADTAGDADGPVQARRILGLLVRIDDRAVHCAWKERLTAALRYFPAASKLVARRVFRRSDTGAR